jgi:arsenite methyltransferase
MSTARPEAMFAADGAARRVEAIYRTTDIVAQRGTIRARLGLEPGERVLDVGCGPGLLCAEMAGAVGAGGRVLGVDNSESMLRIAMRNCAALPGVSITIGDATALPADDGGFDAVVCAQVLEYVPDVAAALAEFRRVLRTGGRLVLVDTDWGSCVWASGDDNRMARVIRAWDAHCPHPRLPRTLPALLAAAGFDVLRAEALPLLSVERSAGTYCEGMQDVIARFVVRSGGVDAAEVDAWADDLAHLEAEGRTFFSLNRYLFRANRPG